MKMFFLGFAVALFLVVYALTVGLFVVTQIPRSAAAVVIASAFPNAQAVETPFTDISHLSQRTQDAIGIIYGLKITAGTSQNTYSPDDRLALYQVLLFTGKTLMVLYH